MTNGEFLQSVSMETLAAVLDRISGCCPEGAVCPPPTNDEPGEDDCSMCWKAWLLTEREVVHTHE